MALGAAVAALNEAEDRRSAAQLERLVARVARAFGTGADGPGSGSPTPSPR